MLAAYIISNGSRCFIKGLWFLSLSLLSSTYGNVAIYRSSLGEVTISSMAEIKDGHYGSTASYFTENVLDPLSVPFTAQTTEWIYKTPQRKPVSSWHEITCLHRKKSRFLKHSFLFPLLSTQQQAFININAGSNQPPPTYRKQNKKIFSGCDDFQHGILYCLIDEWDMVSNKDNLWPIPKLPWHRTLYGDLRK